MLTRTPQDLWRAFRLHRDALLVSALAFDGGMHGEAARLANTAFLLVGRGMRHHKSILDQLGLQDSMQFRTSVPDGSQSGTPLIHATLTCVRTNEWLIELEARGRLALATGRFLSFVEWWEEVVLSDGKQHKLRRQDIVRILRDKDGGAHFDSTVDDPLIEAALRGEVSGFLYEVAGQSRPVPLALEFTMRQIAEEMLAMLKYFDLGHDPEMQPSAAGGPSA